MAIFQVVYSATTKKADHAMFVLCWIAFNPIQVLCGFAHIGSLSDCLFYLIMMMPLIDADWANSPVFSSLLSVVAVYFDPRLLFLTVPIVII